MKARKTIKARIFGLTNRKAKLLLKEYNNWNALIKSMNTNEPNCIDFYHDVNLYSATKQQALRLVKRLGNRVKDKEYPMLLRNDCVNIKEINNKIAKFWFKIPIGGIRGGIKVPIKLPRNQEYLLNYPVKECKLIWKENHWSLHIIIENKIEIPQISTPNVLAVDLGERVIATSVEIVDNQIREPHFYGREVRGLRRHYAWLRKRLGEKKLSYMIKKIGDTEKRKVDAILHKISRDIIEHAKRDNCVILLGNLKGIRKSAKGKGKRFNRIVASMPYYKLSQMIEYKALWDNVPVVYGNEDYSSINCHICNNRGKRPSQGRFVCSVCGEYNADLNGAINQGKRLSGYILDNGGLFDSPLNSGVSK